jgi:hypothetical protein
MTESSRPAQTANVGARVLPHLDRALSAALLPLLRLGHLLPLGLLAALDVVISAAPRRLPPATPRLAFSYPASATFYLVERLELPTTSPTMSSEKWRRRCSTWSIWSCSNVAAIELVSRTD